MSQETIIIQMLVHSRACLTINEVGENLGNQGLNLNKGKKTIDDVFSSPKPRPLTGRVT